MPAPMFNGINRIKIQRTRFEGLGLANTNPVGSPCWRVIDIHEPTRSAAVGPIYQSKAELLADLDRYAKESWGYTI